MSALLLIGYLPQMTTDPTAPSHIRIPHLQGAALALSVNPEEAESEDGILSWAARQNAVLSSYSVTGDVLPIPLGSVFSSKSAVLDRISNQFEHLQMKARELSGHVEFALHVKETAVRQSRPQERPDSGRTFLKQKKEQRHGHRELTKKRRALLSRMSDRVSTVSKSVCRLGREEHSCVLDLALLVPRNGVARLVEQLRDDAAAADALGLRCRLIGPGPAYSFAMRKAEYV